MSLETKTKTKIITFDLGINVLNEDNCISVLQTLRNLTIPRYLHNKLILTYTANYHTNKMSFLFAIDANKLGVAAANHLGPSYMGRLSTSLDPLPTSINPFKYIMIPVDNYTTQTGVWELFIGTSSQPNTHHQFLFNNSDDLLTYYNHPDNDLAKTYADNYVIYHNFNHHGATSDSRFATLGAPGTVDDIIFE